MKMLRVLKRAFKEDNRLQEIEDCERRIQEIAQERLELGEEARQVTKKLEQLKKQS
jgi:hypothetical protein